MKGYEHTMANTPKTPAANLQAINKFNKEKSTVITMRLNNRTDADILERLDTLTESKQGYIKRLIRADMTAHS